MSDFLARFRKQIWDRDHPACPHCSGTVDMTDPDRVQAHVSYWADGEPVPEDCPHCGARIYLQERVERSWTVGRTPDEARDP